MPTPIVAALKAPIQVQHVVEAAIRLKLAEALSEREINELSIVEARITFQVAGPLELLQRVREVPDVRRLHLV